MHGNCVVAGWNRNLEKVLIILTQNVNTLDDGLSLTDSLVNHRRWLTKSGKAKISSDT